MFGTGFHDLKYSSAALEDDINICIHTLLKLTLTTVLSGKVTNNLNLEVIVHA